jgi:hypothetical protein
MSYTPNIPQATDDPSASQPLILANFQQLNSQYGTAGDHVPFTASSNNGTHNKVTWLDQHLAPPSSGLSQVVAYSSTTSFITYPYYKRDTLATVFPLSPIKSMARFQVIAVDGPINPQANSFFNIGSVGSIVQSGGRTIFTVNLTEACRTQAYIVTPYTNQANAFFNIGNTAVNQFSMQANMALPAGTLITFILLEV